MRKMRQMRQGFHSPEAAAMMSDACEALIVGSFRNAAAQAVIAWSTEADYIRAVQAACQREYAAITRPSGQGGN